MVPRVTIYDIAREAKVGLGTVSRVLNNSGSVTPETRKRVLDVVKRLHYQPHTYAQRLARRNSETLAAIIPFFSTYFFAEVLHGVQDRASELGYDLVLYGVSHAEQADAHVSQALKRGKVDGILFFSMKLPPDAVPRLRDSGLPVVLVDTSLPEFDSISVANAEGAYNAVNHLIHLGHRSIGMINASPVSTPAAERLSGYRRALQDQGIPFSEDLVRTGRNTKVDGFNREAGYEAMIEFVKMGSGMPRAFFISSDIQAMGAISALEEKGLKVPEDVAIVGFDDIELASHIGLTTMRQPMYQMGALAVDRLVKRMATPGMEILHTRFSPTLIVRESCGARAKSHD
jgi:LacI family transcriptional regulator